MSGYLEKEELRKTLSDASPFHISEELLDSAWNRLDSNGDGRVTFDDFVMVIVASQYRTAKRSSVDDSARFARGFLEQSEESIGS